MKKTKQPSYSFTQMHRDDGFQSYSSSFEHRGERRLTTVRITPPMTSKMSLTIGDGVTTAFFDTPGCERATFRSPKIEQAVRKMGDEFTTHRPD